VFHNSDAIDYVSERIYLAFHGGALPVYFGTEAIDDFIPSRDAMIRVSDFADVAALARHLNHLNSSPAEYLKYFRWRQLSFVQTSPVYQRLDSWSKIPWQCVLCERIRTRYLFNSVCNNTSK
jgi:hypothetical protein